ncbi:MULTISPECIES: leucine-rich repeat protein [unclassified Ruminococcus]|uniref:leucine-rich repeat protein n=1 Tax=unclassified Ruminococcus TaxID=2608920 RepID=UPI00210C5EFF|nr:MULTISPECIES: leucine-rich repeat protein [unclassified Ruminococcus]
MKKLLKRCTAVVMSALMAASVICAGAVGTAALDTDTKKVLPLGVSSDCLAAVASGRGDIHVASSAQDDSYYEYYVKSDGSAEIVNFVGDIDYVYVPDELNGVIVTSIGDTAFYDNTSLSEITLPKSVVSIGNYAFAGCTNLMLVSIPESKLKSVGNFAFAGCSYLDHIEDWSSNIEFVGERAFDDTLWYKSNSAGPVYLGKVVIGYIGDMKVNAKIAIKDGTKGIASAAFANFTNLASVSIPESVKNIGEAAFVGCTSLKEISFPSSITRMGAGAFFDTAWYSNQPDGMIYIGDIAYGYKGEMPANTKITIKDGTRLVAGLAFYGQLNLKSVVLPESVQVIDELAFYYAENLSSINIPNSVTTIGALAFCACDSLKTVKLPKTVRTIENIAFGYDINEESGQIEQASGFTVQGYNNTEAQFYCETFGVSFKSLGTVKATGVKLNKTSMTMGIHEEYTLAATVSPSYVNQNVSWSSSNTSVAQVSKSGRITAKSTGTATITAKKDGKTATCKITVKKAPTSITLNASRITLEIGETFDLNSSLPSGQASYAIYYTSDNSSVASVKKAGGLVTAVSVGEATVTATTYNGLTASCKVAVKMPLIYGDLNKDGKVNLRDAIEIQKISLSMIELNEDKSKCGDVDKNGRVNLLDSIYVQKYAANMNPGISGIGEKVPATEPVEPSTDPDIPSSDYNLKYASEVISLVNAERSKVELSPLTQRSDVTEVAQIRAEEISRVFSHTRPNGSDCFTLIEENNIQWRTVGENIAAGQSTPQEVMNSWMNSQGHRENILNPEFNGIGVACFKKDGILYWTQMFICA